MSWLVRAPIRIPIITDAEIGTVLYRSVEASLSVYRSSYQYITSYTIIVMLPGAGSQHMVARLIPIRYMMYTYTTASTCRPLICYTMSIVKSG